MSVGGFAAGFSSGFEILERNKHMSAILKHGSPLMGNYTPAGAIAAAEVVEVGNIPVVAHDAIAASVLGAVALRGGVYLGVAGEALTAGEKVYYNTTAGKFYDASGATTGDLMFGWVAPESSASADGDAILVIHAPNGDVAS